MKRLLSLLLALMVLLGSVPAVAFRASAQETAAESTEESTAEETAEPTEEATDPTEEPTDPPDDTVDEFVEYVTSDECINVIKSFEGFSKYPYEDNGQYTVGYGTRCPDDKYTYYMTNGITEEEAIALLRSHIAGVEEQVNAFNVKYELYFTQNEFDAIVCFSYNCGTAWLYKTTGTFLSAVLNGAADNDFIYAITLWCNSGGSPLVGLINRRLCEANMYLNGVYSATPPENYCYVLYNGNGGTTSPRVQGYDSALTAEIVTTPSRDGYSFDGWFTSQTGGEQITVLDASVKSKTLYAHWTALPGTETDTDTTGVTVTVTNNTVNLREGPGTNYSIIGTANIGDQFLITETATGSGYTWGKYDGGWVCLKYTNYDEVIAQQPTEPDDSETEDSGTSDTEETTTVMGTVVVNSVLRIRSGPGTSYSVAGQLSNGARVEILEQTMVGTVTWGRIEQGWISMDYVVLDEVTHTCTDVICTECGTINADSGETVTLDGDLALTELTVPAGVTLDLNGFTLTADCVLSFGDIIDCVGTGALVTTDFVLSSNSYLPVWDSANCCYRFYACELRNVGVRRAGESAVFGFALVFANSNAYSLLQTTEDAKLEITVTLSWGENEMPFAFSQELLQRFAETQIKYPKLQSALLLTATGLDALSSGAELSAVFSVAAADGQICMESQPVVYTNI